MAVVRAPPSPFLVCCAGLLLLRCVGSSSMEPLSPPTSPQRGARPAARQQAQEGRGGVVVPRTLLERALTETWRRENAEVRAAVACSAAQASRGARGAAPSVPSCVQQRH
jgi:hypothetical protein